MAAININMNFADTGDNGSGPYTLVVRRGATAPADGTVLLTDTADPIRNFHDLCALGYSHASGYIASQNESDPYN